MKIGCDAKCIIDDKKTGIGYYAYNLIKELQKKENITIHYHLFKNSCINNLLNKNDIFYTNSNLFSHMTYYLLSYFFHFPYHYLFGKNDDFTIFFNYIVPAGVSGKKIVMIHDMAYKRYPYTVKLRTRLWLELGMKRTVHIADKILTPSEFSKQEIIKYLKVDPNKIATISCGVDKSLYHPNYTNKTIEKVKQKYEIIGDYYLYTGTIEPRKNIKQLLIAYAELTKEQSELPLLVIVGKKGWFYKEIFDTVIKYKIENKVIFTGYIPENDVAILMNGTKIFIYPSIYEGFGMPVLEAMACKAAIITSSVSSLPEVTDNSAVLINPFSISDIKNAILKLENNKIYRQYIAQSGYYRSKKFSWDIVADNVYNMLNNI